MTYTAPTRDMQFLLEHVAGLKPLLDAGAFPDLSDDLIQAVLDESAKLARDVIAPLNEAGDSHGARLEDGTVTTAPGFADAYAKYIEGGWNGIAADPDFGGQGLPHALALACIEMVYGANMSFSLCPMLTAAAIDALTEHGTQEQKSLYLPKLVSGEWTGTMCLTEPQAGSDVGALRTRAEKQDDGTYRIKGSKIFITYGEHDMAENIIHMVLARLPDAPAGTKGISLFLVPKFLVNGDGSLGARNDLKAVGLEHKLGIHASPTCTMAFGETEGAVGYLIGAENRGMATMFTMMNAARLNVGTQGVGIAERATQQALAYAQERRQGRAPDGDGAAQIIAHPDVRRMVMTMKALTEAARAICYANAVAIDTARHHPDEAQREKAKLREELLTPISKAFSTDLAVEIASIGIQVHGGMGFIEETGAAQHLRDARILPIYEGTNGIQAIDLVGRKLRLGDGAAVADFIEEARGAAAALKDTGDDALSRIGSELSRAVGTLEDASEWLTSRMGGDAVRDGLAGATPYLRLFGTVAGGHYLGVGALKAHQAMADGSAEDPFLKARRSVAAFYAKTILPQAEGLAAATMAGADDLYALTPDEMAH